MYVSVPTADFILAEHPIAAGVVCELLYFSYQCLSCMLLHALLLLLPTIHHW